jgi:HSP20 family protein
MMTRHFSPLLNMSDDLDMLRKQLNRAFAPEETTIESRAWALPIELIESADSYQLRAMLPGLHPDNVDVSATAKTITIEGELMSQERSKDSRLLHSEFSYGKFRRVIEFAVPIVNDKIDASYQNGVLTLTIPKEEAAQRKTVKVKINE